MSIYLSLCSSFSSFYNGRNWNLHDDVVSSNLQAIVFQKDGRTQTNIFDRLVGADSPPPIQPVLCWARS